MTSEDVRATVLGTLTRNRVGERVSGQPDAYRERIAELVADALEASAVSTPSGHDEGCEEFYVEYGAPEGGVCKVCGGAVSSPPTGAKDDPCGLCGHAREHHYKSDGCYGCLDKRTPYVQPDPHEFVAVSPPPTITEARTEYRSAVAYRTDDGSLSIRETAQTRWSIEEAQADADADLPGMYDWADDEPEIYRVIVSRQRFEPTEWVTAALHPGGETNE